MGAMKTIPVKLIRNLTPNAQRIPRMAQGKSLIIEEFIPQSTHPRSSKQPTINHTRARFLFIRPLLTLTFTLFLILTTTTGCAATRNHSPQPRIDNTTLTSIDLVRMTDQMSTSLIASGIIDASTPEKPFIIVADRVVNRTSQIIDVGEKQLFLTKLRATLNQNPYLKKQGVIFVARPDELSQFSEPISENSSINKKYLGPTHALTAVFTTLTNVDRTERDETYECDFQLQNLKTRKIQWEDAYTVRYVVKRGKVW